MSVKNAKQIQAKLEILLRSHHVNLLYQQLFQK